MDKAYEGDDTQQLILDLDMMPVVPPKINRLTPWECDKETYKKMKQIGCFVV